MDDSDWPFAGYPKMTDTPEKWALTPDGRRAMARVRWAVTEKIHGANFALVTDGVRVRCANRRRFLEAGEPFFGYETIRDAYADPVRALFAAVQADAPGMARLWVYGELFGGGYPHPDIPAIPGVQPVQTGVWYAPDVRFCAFDFYAEGERGGFVDYEDARRMCAEAGIPFAAPLLIGRWQDALAHPVRFDSTIPRTLGLPSLPAGGNPAEGVVVRPVREIHPSGGRGPVRPILKRKLPEFAEDRRFHEAERWPEPSPAGSLPPLEMLKWEAYNRVTRNRLDATVSKVGDIRRGDARRLQTVFALFVEEVLTEAREAAPDADVRMNAEECARLRRFVEEEARTLLRSAAVAAPGEGR